MCSSSFIKETDLKIQAIRLSPLSEEKKVTDWFISQKSIEKFSVDEPPDLSKIEGNNFEFLLEDLNSNTLLDNKHSYEVLNYSIAKVLENEITVDLLQSFYCFIGYFLLLFVQRFFFQDLLVSP